MEQNEENSDDSTYNYNSEFLISKKYTHTHTNTHIQAQAHTHSVCELVLESRCIAVIFELLLQMISTLMACDCMIMFICVFNFFFSFLFLIEIELR